MFYNVATQYDSGGINLPSQFTHMIYGLYQFFLRNSYENFSKRDEQGKFLDLYIITSCLGIVFNIISALWG